MNRKILVRFRDSAPHAKIRSQIIPSLSPVCALGFAGAEDPSKAVPELRHALNDGPNCCTVTFKRPKVASGRCCTNPNARIRELAKRMVLARVPFAYSSSMGLAAFNAIAAGLRDRDEKVYHLRWISKTATLPAVRPTSGGIIASRPIYVKRDHTP